MATKKSKNFCSKHEEFFHEIYEGEFECLSCYEDLTSYQLSENDVSKLLMSTEYYQLMQDSE